MFDCVAAIGYLFSEHRKSDLTLVFWIPNKTASTQRTSIICTFSMPIDIINLMPFCSGVRDMLYVLDNQKVNYSEIRPSVGVTLITCR